MNINIELIFDFHIICFGTAALQQVQQRLDQFSFFSILYHDMVQLVIIFAPDFAAYGRRAQRSYPYH